MEQNLNSKNQNIDFSLQNNTSQTIQKTQIVSYGLKA